jgi:hypothetical protein
LRHRRKDKFLLTDTEKRPFLRAMFDFAGNGIQIDKLYADHPFVREIGREYAQRRSSLPEKSG